MQRHTQKKCAFSHIKKSLFKKIRLRQRLPLTTQHFLQKNNFFATCKNLHFLSVKASFSIVCLIEYINNTLLV